MSHLHQLFGVRQGILRGYRRRSGRGSAGNKLVSTTLCRRQARFRRQLPGRWGIGYTVQRRGSALYHGRTYWPWHSCRTGGGGEMTVSAVAPEVRASS